MSSGAAVSLLARDREQLERVGRFLEEERQGFFVLVCRPELRPSTIRYLEEKGGKAIPQPLAITDHDTMVMTMVALDGKPRSAVDCIALDAVSIDVWTAMNWHREKLRRGGQVLLWLDSTTTLEGMTRHAPDAYSFREAVIVLEGEGERAPEWEGEEPPDVKTARLLFDLPQSPEERAEAAVGLADALAARGRLDELVRVASEGLALIPEERFGNEREHVTRVGLYQRLIAACEGLARHVDAFRFCQQAAGELQRSTVDGAQDQLLWVEVRAASLSPLGADRHVVERAQQAIAAGTIHFIREQVHVAAGVAAVRRGRFSEASSHYDDCMAMLQNPLYKKAYFFIERAELHRTTGRLDLARDNVVSAREAYHRSSYPDRSADLLDASLLLDRGELAASSRFFSESEVPALRRAVVRLPASLAAGVLYRLGDVDKAIQRVVEGIRIAIAERKDRVAHGECAVLVALLEEGKLAEAVSMQTLSEGLGAVDFAGRALIEYAAGNPPWYEVLFCRHRAAVLSLFDSRHEEAIAAASEAVSLARLLWEQALPWCTRTLVQCLARAGRFRDMEPVIADALRCAEEADDLRELATVQAYDLVRILTLRLSKTHVDKAFADLRSTFSEMDAPRLEGETWLEIAPYFPPLSAHPDPIEIADRVHGLFLDMPMPEPAARCMEWLGDIYAARGDRSHAGSCYKMSLGGLDRYGLLLRRPLVQKKLSSVT